MVKDRLERRFDWRYLLLVIVLVYHRQHEIGGLQLLVLWPLRLQKRSRGKRGLRPRVCFALFGLDLSRWLNGFSKCEKLGILSVLGQISTVPAKLGHSCTEAYREPN